MLEMLAWQLTKLILSFSSNVYILCIYCICIYTPLQKYWNSNANFFIYFLYLQNVTTFACFILIFFDTQ